MACDLTSTTGVFLWKGWRKLLVSCLLKLLGAAETSSLRTQPCSRCLKALLVPLGQAQLMQLCDSASERSSRNLGLLLLLQATSTLILRALFAGLLNLVIASFSATVLEHTSTTMAFKKQPMQIKRSNTKSQNARYPRSPKRQPLKRKQFSEADG